MYRKIDSFEILKFASKQSGSICGANHIRSRANSLQRAKSKPLGSVGRSNPALAATDYVGSQMMAWTR